MISIPYYLLILTKTPSKKILNMRLNYVHNLKMGVPILSHYGLQDTVRNYDGFYWTAPYLWLVYLNLGNVKKNWVFIIYSWTKKKIFFWNTLGIVDRIKTFFMIPATFLGNSLFDK